MTDIFIFFAEEDDGFAGILAQDLKSRGVSVRRECAPAGTEEENAQIRRELDEAKAVIVIWSEAAVQSEWVCNGAAVARETARLVQAIVDGFQARHIPLPYHVFDLTLVSDSGGIIRNIDKLLRIRGETQVQTDGAREHAGTSDGYAPAPVEKEKAVPAESPALAIAPAPLPSAAEAPAAAAPPPTAKKEAPIPLPRAPQRLETPPAPPAFLRPSRSENRRRSADAAVNIPAAGKLVENIPRLMHVAVSERIEVRLSREETSELLAGFEGRGTPQAHGIQVTQAMCVMLRARSGTFHIQNLSPETQWVYERPGVIGPKFGRWRWDVTPLKRGKHKLLVIVSARTARNDGMSGDVALPDQVIAVSVRANVTRGLVRFGQWAGIAVAGGALTEGAVWLLRMLAK
jgi:hypothetical protein